MLHVSKNKCFNQIVSSNSVTVKNCINELPLFPFLTISNLYSPSSLSARYKRTLVGYSFPLIGLHTILIDNNGCYVV